jgi:NAD(P)-dependent dehydrogenase (short-subunit alcohol dehydrogenase family)
MMFTEKKDRKALMGQVALVTGGGRGIGQAIAVELAKAGAAVAVAARTEGQVLETAALIEEVGGQALALVADMTDRQAVAKMLEELKERYGVVDILVNNAGRHHALGPLWQVDPDDWWQDIESNLRSTFLCTRLVLPAMVERQRGRIINVSSGAGNEPRPYSTAYSTVKAAVTRLTENIALSTKDYGIYAFAIHPGSVRTEMADYLIESEAGQRWVPEFRTIYAETEIAPQQAAQLTVFLASGKADALSGRFINVYDDVNELLQQSEQIQKEQLYTLRLRK